MNATSFIDLMNDPAHIAHGRATREREEREAHERRVRRGSHVETSAGVKPSAQQLRDSINTGRKRDDEGRALNFESDVRSASRPHDRRVAKKDQAHDRR